MNTHFASGSFSNRRAIRPGSACFTGPSASTLIHNGILNPSGTFRRSMAFALRSFSTSSSDGPARFLSLTPPLSRPLSPATLFAGRAVGGGGIPVGGGGGGGGESITFDNDRA